MSFSQSFSSTFQKFFINAFTKFSSLSIENSLKSSSNLKYIDSQKHLVQYSHHDNSVKKKELQSQFKEWWNFIEIKQKNSDQSQFSESKLI